MTNQKYRTDVFRWNEKSGEILDHEYDVVAVVMSDSAADPQDGDGPIMAAARDLLYVLEGAMAFLDKLDDHHILSVNEFIEQSGFTARATEAIRKARA